MTWLKENWLLIVIVFLGGIIYFSIKLGKSEVFNDVAVGLGALLAGLGGLIAFINWMRDTIVKNKFRDLVNKYSTNKLVKNNADNGTFKLLRFNNGKIFIYDLNEKKKLWIRNGRTYEELGYYKDDYEAISDKDIEKYEDFTQGEDIVAPYVNRETNKDFSQSGGHPPKQPNS
jgi:hypothetical protein